MTVSLFADVILPLAVKGRFTYLIGDDCAEYVHCGVMVRVQFGGKKLLTGIVFAIDNIAPDLKNIKRIIEVLNSVPVINEKQLKLWEWISDYYLCTEG